MRVLMMLIPDAPDTRTAQLTMDRLAEPYYHFLDAGIEVVLATPEGGWWAVADGSSNSEAVRRFGADRAARDALADTLAIDDVDGTDFDAAFCIGTLGAIAPAAADTPAELVAGLLRAGKPVAMLPRATELAPHDSTSGLLIFGEDAAAPRQAALALLGVLQGK